ncbi:uncharacterized protein PFL1_04145 [Pseudozyma flocculosa PF-1]|uniref:Lipase n=2 Tax=Pseudozyma flocculosa TaxID=84751 RepID=A0A5C3ET74_9BASI|nr:uncharacterized protein PFL1_04145 [Pseudozyma flocculosa PF-1]EPQ28318.1 hypothetical protein PFL1_04145 [Pseudozyma flocculosa PF-1]SPO35468.1 related to lipase precursor [Pseudozyma flocculosa]
MHMRTLAPLLAALAALAGLPAVLARPFDGTGTDFLLPRANPDFPNPNVDPFYQAPDSLAPAQNGQVLKRRPVPTTIQSIHLDSTYQLYYRTENTQGSPTGTVATIFVPKKPASPPKVLSVQWYEDAVSFDCSPSYALVQNSGSSSAVIAFLDIGIYTQWALSQGYYVVQADHEGPKASFIAGFNSGKAVLDGIKALINDQKLPQDTQVAMTGYSGGAHATVWAETLHEEYAPSIKLVGSVHGGTPVDPRGTLLLINKGPFAGFAFAGLIGLMSQHPDLDAYVRSILGDAGRKKLAEFTSNGYCLPSVVALSPFQDIFSYTNATDPINNPRVVKVLKEESLLSSYSSRSVPVPKHPRLIFHGVLDEIVPYKDNAQYVREQCAKGADIQFNSLVAEHITGELFGIVGVINFLKQSFAGEIPKVKCGSILPDYQIGLFDPRADDIMGKDIADEARSLKGKKSPFGGNF